ncbi:TPM domain-containing protein, partial [Limnofasciculus baicalensis]
MFKKTFWLFIITLAIIAFSPGVMALRVEEVPTPRQTGTWVTDMANTLSPETEAKLNQMISELSRQNSCEIMVVTVPETSPYSTPKEFTTTWFNYWTIGQKGLDNGVLFMYSHGDNRIEIETGYGVTDILPDAWVVDLIKQKIRPQFNLGNYDGGTLVGTQELIAVLKTYQPHQSPNSSTTEVPFYGSNIPIITLDKKTTLLLTNTGIILSLISGVGMLLISHKLALISPQGNERIKGLDSHDKPVYYLVCLFLFSISFTAALTVDAGVIAASLAGGMNCILFYRSLNRSSIQVSTSPKLLNSRQIIYWGCSGCFYIPSIIIIIIYINLFVVPGLILALLTGGILYVPLSIIPKKMFDNKRKRRSIRPLHCAKCQQQMKQLDSISLLSHLREPESVAQNLGSVVFEGWECSRCRPKLIAQGINIRAYVVDTNKFSICPNCQELTVTSKEKITLEATELKEGSKLITDTCQCCSYGKVTEKIIPRIS